MSFAEQLLAGIPSNYIFNSLAALTLSPEYAPKIDETEELLIKKPDIRFYDLRHTAATLMFKQGVHPKVVQERLGHSDISLTLNTYSHVLPSMQDDAADLLDELLVPIKVEGDMKASSENEDKKPPQKLER